jgi:hypothetical protein
MKKSNARHRLFYSTFRSLSRKRFALVQQIRLLAFGVIATVWTHGDGLPPQHMVRRSLFRDSIRLTEHVVLPCQRLSKVKANVAFVLPLGNRRLPHGTAGLRYPELAADRYGV